MKTVEVTQVVALMNEDEVDLFAHGVSGYSKGVEAAGMKVDIVDLSIPSPPIKTVIGIIEKAEAAAERIVVHCATGNALSGNSNQRIFVDPDLTIL